MFLEEEPFVPVFVKLIVKNVEFGIAPRTLADSGIQVVDIPIWRNCYLSLHSMSLLS